MKRERTRWGELEASDGSAAQLSAVARLTAAMCSDQRVVLFPCGPSNCPRASSQGPVLPQR